MSEFTPRQIPVFSNRIDYKMNTFPVLTTFIKPVRITLTNGRKKWICTEIHFQNTDLSENEKVVTNSMFEDFECVFYSRDEKFSAKEISNYIQVLRELDPVPGNDHLYDIVNSSLGFSSQGSVSVLEAIYDSFDYIHNYPHQGSIGVLLSLLPEHPGHRDIYFTPSVKNEYERRLEDIRDENLKRAVEDYLSFEIGSKWGH